MTVEKKWLVNGEYFYIPHYKYEGIFELYYVDKNGIDHCIQNFCLEENAMAFVKEDQKWKKMGSKLSHRTNIDWAIDLDKPLKSSNYHKEEDVDQEEAKREARRKRREARKEKNKKENNN